MSRLWKSENQTRNIKQKSWNGLQIRKRILNVLLAGFLSCYTFVLLRVVSTSGRKNLFIRSRRSYWLVPRQIQKFRLQILLSRGKRTELTFEFATASLGNQKTRISNVVEIRSEIAKTRRENFHFRVPCNDQQPLISCLFSTPHHPFSFFVQSQQEITI